jgi:hypothetical protein
VVLAGLLVGCGRIGFDASGAPGPDAALPCPMFATFCDDFETGDTSRWSSLALNGGTLTVEGMTVHTGRFALEAIQPGGPGGSSTIVEHMLGGTQATGTLAVRAWMYAPTGLSNFAGVINLRDSTLAHYTLVAGDSAGLWVASETGTAGLHDHHSSSPVATATWSCIEIDYVFSPPGIALYVDDAQVVTAAATDTAPAYDRVTVGAQNITASREVIVDDIVVAAQHVGCQ